jgi:hypothetical protein
LDDIIIFSKSIEEHAKHLEQVLACLQTHNFKAKLSKCEFSQEQLQFLGHVINAEGSSMDPAKVKVVKDWPLREGQKVRRTSGGRLPDILLKRSAGYPPDIR